MRKLLLLVFILFIPFSCQKSITKEENRESDIVYAKSLIQNFYNYCDSKNIDQINMNLSREVDINVISKVISIKDSLGFDMKNYKIENIETYYSEISESDSITKKLEIHAFVKAFKGDKSISENLNFLKINNESPKITGYHIKG